MKRPMKNTPSGTHAAQLPDLRRRLLLHLAAFAPFSGAVFGQGAAQPIAISKLHSFGLRVSDVGRSVSFYQQLFGMPIQAQEEGRVSLGIGDGPRFLSLKAAGMGEAPGITHITLSVPDFNAERLLGQLQAKGFAEVATPDPAGGLRNAMKAWPINESLIGFADQEGLMFQLCHPRYCGSNNGQCATTAAPRGPGLMALLDLNHFTNYMSHAPRTNQFYLDLFGLRVQSYQGPTSPTVGVGDGKQFLMFVGPAQEGVPAQPARIDHVSLAVADFGVEAIQAKLESVGIRPRTDPAVTPPLVHWVSMRMPNRGGAEGGTPELYFSDPDGLHIQLQDARYCGGGGYLGDECSPPA